MKDVLRSRAARWRIRRDATCEELKLARSPARKHERHARVLEIMLHSQSRNTP